MKMGGCPEAAYFFDYTFVRQVIKVFQHVQLHHHFRFFRRPPKVSTIASCRLFIDKAEINCFLYQLRYVVLRYSVIQKSLRAELFPCLSQHADHASSFTLLLFIIDFFLFSHFGIYWFLAFFLLFSVVSNRLLCSMAVHPPKPVIRRKSLLLKAVRSNILSGNT